MNMSCITGGAVLMLISILLTIFTLGFGIICTGPLFLIGFIIFIIGFIISDGTKREEIHHYHNNTVHQTPSLHNRYCTDCSRAIPFDANICPYCGHKF